MAWNADNLDFFFFCQISQSLVWIWATVECRPDFVRAARAAGDSWIFEYNGTMCARGQRELSMCMFGLSCQWVGDFDWRRKRLTCMRVRVRVRAANPSRSAVSSGGLAEVERWEAYCFGECFSFSSLASPIPQTREEICSYSHPMLDNNSGIMLLNCFLRALFF